MSVKVVTAINGMNKLGHDAHLCKLEGKVWVEIDHCMLASFEEIEKLVDGVHSFEDVTEIFKRGTRRYSGTPDFLAKIAKSY